MILNREFYSRPTTQVAIGLLGKMLVRRIDDIVMSGVIVETEAYGYADDAASHAYRRRTARNEAMFGDVGRSYVYFTYGMHYCFNVVARDRDAAAGAVLVRSIIPDTGIDHMVRHRGRDTHLADGPAKLTQAMKITKEQYGVDLTIYGPLYITDAPPPGDIQYGPRVGVRDDRLWNYSVTYNDHKRGDTGSP